MPSTNTRRPVTWYPPVLTPRQQFRQAPIKYLARWIYQTRRRLPNDLITSSSTSPISIVCISDTHTTQPHVPEGDLLLHAGDMSNGGSFAEIQAQLDWLKTLPHTHKVMIAGNHDLLLDPNYVARFPDRIYEREGTSCSDLDWGDIIYLCNTSAHLKFPNGHSITVYGSPWTEQFGTWAFQYPQIRQVWPTSVPPGTDILFTHGPPKGHLDEGGKGCPQLLWEIWRARPQLVVFGHIHAGYGREDIVYDTVEAAYDGVIAGDKGLAAIILMAWWLLCTRLWDTVPHFRLRQRDLDSTILVNASAVPGRRGDKSQPAIVVEL